MYKVVAYLRAYMTYICRMIGNIVLYALLSYVFIVSSTRYC